MDEGRLAPPSAPQRIRPRKLGERIASRLDAAALILLLCVAPLGLGMYGLDRMHRDAAKASALAAWRRAQPAIVARLAQPKPPEYGAVWSTHKGRICGLVNGWGSFGGLAGMTDFYVWHGKPTFKTDVSPEAFARAWGECAEDTWIELVRGSMQPGWCATRQGAKTCKWTG
jgi:hypothetical protein